MIRAAFHKTDSLKGYPELPPFDPPEAYPELRHLYGGEVSVDRSNHVYETVRNLLCRLSLDAQHIGTESWNPLRELASPGQQVLIKPNLVTHRHPWGETALVSTICHASVIRVLIDYARLAVSPGGRIIVGDTPLENCHFDVLCRATKLLETVELLRERGAGDLELLDFRTYGTEQHHDGSIETFELAGDPRGYSNLDLGRLSLLQELEDRHGPQNYYTLGDHTIDHMNPRVRGLGMPNSYHANGRHIYRIANTVLDSHLVISAAKLKTHHLAGVTLSLKNSIGICDGKAYMPHFRPGTPDEGGDAFPSYPSLRYLLPLRLRRSIYAIAGRRGAPKLQRMVSHLRGVRLPHQIHSEPLFGNWHGNDTIWRTILDLSLILMHGSRNGVNPEVPQRRFLGVVDGIVGMDHDAPLAGVPVSAGLALAGRDPVALDTLGTFLMGLDPRRIPTLSGTIADQCSALGSPLLYPDSLSGNVALKEAQVHFVPSKGWKTVLESGIEEWPFT